VLVYNNDDQMPSELGHFEIKDDIVFLGPYTCKTGPHCDVR